MKILFYRPSVLLCCALSVMMTGCVGCGPRVLDSEDEIAQEQEGDTACESDADCIATFYECASIDRGEQLPVTCSHTQDQPLYPEDACPDPASVSSDILDRCACRQGACAWP